MVFNSFVFLVFFVIVFTLFYSLKPIWRKWLLLLSSCIFYMWFIPYYLLVLFVTIGIDYVAAIKIEDASKDSTKKMHLVLGVVNTCLVLFVFKYFNFFIDNVNAITGVKWTSWNVILPIGLSFHTFQSLSYVIEVYRKNIKAERSLLNYSNFVMFFPQLVAGPIERANNLLPQLSSSNQSLSIANFSIGLSKFFWGLFKKVVVADTAAKYVDATYNNYLQQPGSMLLVGTFLFAIQIYGDFSGYSDMAIGIAKMLGFDFKENFKTPYFSKSVTEFWRRWHISLSSWLRDYLYISFGGNKVGRLNIYRNLMLTMLIGGLWHGASWNFVIWGALNGMFLSFEKLINFPIKKSTLAVVNLFRSIYVFAAISLTWVFFRATNFQQATTIIKKILLGFQLKSFKMLNPNIFIAALLGISIMVIFEYFLFRKKSFAQIYLSKYGWQKLLLLSLFFAFVSLLFGNASGGQFIYFQF